MTVNLNVVGFPNHLVSLTPVYPSIEGETSGVTLTSGYAPRIKQTTPPAAGGGPYKRIGARVNLPAPLNLAGYDWLSICQDSTTYGTAENISSLATGGIRLIYIDGSGNYAGYNLYGAIAGYSGDNASGYLTSYTGGLMTFHIASDRVPDISGGVIDWTNIVAYEFSINTNHTSAKDLSLFRPVKRNAPSVTGVAKIADINLAFTTKHAGGMGGAQSDSFDSCFFITVGKFRQVNSQRSYYVRLGFTIGDGVTPTNFQDGDFSIGFENPYDKFPAFMSTGQWILFGPGKVRPIKIIQSASDVLALTDASFASSGHWQWRLSGSGVATCTRISFWRFDGFTAAHGNYIDCSWNGADAPVEVTAATVITRGLIREAVASGLKLLSGAGVYSNLDLKIDSSAGTYDVELGEGGAGTYELPHITVPAGRTLRVRNNSASNAIVVVLPPGTLYSATTAGGSITVVSAGTKLTITDLPLGCDAVVLTAGTSTVLAQADELPGATFVFEYTGAPVVDIGIFKPGYKPRYLRNLQLAATDSAIPVSLEIDRSYLP